MLPLFHWALPQSVHEDCNSSSREDSDIKAGGRLLRWLLLRRLLVRLLHCPLIPCSRVGGKRAAWGVTVTPEKSRKRSWWKDRDI